GNMWYIQSVFVDKQHRGKGVFKNLYRHVIDLAKLAEVMFVRLYVETDNEAAQKVYESLGMKRMPYYMYDIKID
ncbi:MAG: ribosomal protein S18 acetylase RimI-like enzyme, partial [Mariniblastus sp.]